MENQRGGKRGPYKRNRRGEQQYHTKQKSEDKLEGVDESSPVICAFREYQQELDSKHDKYERLVKVSRDITIESKRIIFLLHRISSDSDRDKVLDEAESRLKSVEDNLISKIARELKGENPHQYLRSFSSGLQEYIEAVSFYYFIKEGRLVLQEEIEDKLAYPEKEELRKSIDDQQKQKTDADVTDPATPIPPADVSLPDTTTPSNDELTSQTDSKLVSLKLPPLEYMLGLADFTGELMRMCINVIGSGDLEKPFELVKFMRTLYEGFQLLGNLAGREMVRKSSVMRQSLKKVEDACYVIKVRGSEMPKHMLKDALFSIERENRDEYVEMAD